MILFLNLALCTSFHTLSQEYNNLYFSILYRLKLTSRMALERETSDIYDCLTKKQDYTHAAYFFSLYSDLESVNYKFSESLVLEKVFSELIDDLINTEDLFYDNNNQEIANFEFHSFKNESKFNTMRNILKSELLVDQRDLNYHFYFFLIRKYSSILNIKNYAPEIHNTLFFIFSLIELFDQDIISRVLGKYAVIYSVLKKFKEGDILAIGTVYNLIEDIIDTLHPFLQCSIQFQTLKSEILESSRQTYISQDPNLKIIRNFGIIFLLEKFVEWRCKNLSLPLSRIYSRLPDPYFKDISITYVYLEKLISYFYSLN